MAATSSDMIEYLTEDLRNKYAQLIPLLHKIASLVQTFNHDDAETRKRSLPRWKEYETNLCQELMKRITNAKEKLDFGTQTISEAEKKQVLAAIQNSFAMVGCYFSALQIATEHAARNIGACQEIATLSLGILMELYGLGQSKTLSLETIDILFRGLSHELIVINRDQTKDIKSAEDLGRDCLIFDPQQKLLYSPANIPSGVILSFPKMLGYQINVACTNDFGLSSFAQWAQHPVLGNILTSYQKIIGEYCREKLHEMLPPRFKILAAEKVDSFLQEASELCTDKSFLIQCIEEKSGLSFTGVKTEDWRTHHFARLPSTIEKEKALELQKKLPGHGIITTVKDYGNILFFANTNCNESKSLSDDVSRVMKAELPSEIRNVTG